MALAAPGSTAWSLRRAYLRHYRPSPSDARGLLFALLSSCRHGGPSCRAATRGLGPRAGPRVSTGAPALHLLFGGRIATGLVAAAVLWRVNSILPAHLWLGASLRVLEQSLALRARISGDAAEDPESWSPIALVAPPLVAFLAFGRRRQRGAVSSCVVQCGLATSARCGMSPSGCGRRASSPGGAWGLLGRAPAAEPVPPHCSPRSGGLAQTVAWHALFARGRGIAPP